MLQEHLDHRRHNALGWLQAERTNLIAAAHQAVEYQPLAGVAVGLAAALFWFLQTSGYWAAWRELNELAVEVTRRLGDREGHSQSLNDLAAAYSRFGRIAEAIDCLERSLRIRRELGDREGEQAVLSNLGIAYREAGRFEEAISCCEQSLSICRESGDRYGEGMLLNSLGGSIESSVSSMPRSPRMPTASESSRRWTMPTAKAARPSTLGRPASRWAVQGGGGVLHP
jgi:tetratricopeptide (TPR) repeat protein